MRKLHIIQVLFLFIVMLSVVQIVVSSRLSTTGIVLGKLENSLKNYSEENEKLREKLLLSSSLTQIASSAASLGFVSEKSQIVLTGPLPIAIRD